MANPTIKSIAEDLSLAMEVDGSFGYGLAKDGKSIIIETYSDEGDIEETYTLTVDIKKAG